MSSFTVYIDNTSFVELNSLTAEVDDSLINDATVTFTVTDTAYNETTGTTWPITMSFIASGNYRGVLPSTVVLVDQEEYFCIIDADDGAGRIGHWEIPFIAVIRTASSSCS